MSSLTPTDRERLQIKGRQLFRDLQSAISRKGNEYQASPPALEPRYRKSIINDGIPGIPDDFMDKVGELSLPQYGYYYIEVNNDPPGKTAPYQNHIHQEGKAIVCAFNYSIHDNLGSARMHWSDIIAASCLNIMAITEGSMSNLKTVWRICIQNQDTLNVMNWISSRADRNV